MRNLVKIGKELSYLLRHDDTYEFDKHGYRTVEDLIRNHGYTMIELETLVETNDKKRYEFNEDKTLIRARQGHSVKVDVELKECVPPEILYHGTATRFVDSIRQVGINKASRLFVHLTDNKEVAEKTGARHGKPYVFIVESKMMYEQGYKFYLSNNGVWLTEYIPANYLRV